MRFISYPKVLTGFSLGHYAMHILLINCTKQEPAMVLDWIH